MAFMSNWNKVNNNNNKRLGAELYTNWNGCSSPLKRLTITFMAAFCSINRRRTLIWIPTEQKSIPCMITARIQRGAITLSAYNYTIKYRLGSQNENIDFFSRYASKYVKGEDSSIATNLNSYVHQ